MTRKLILMAIVAVGLLLSDVATSKAQAGRWLFNSYYGQWMYYR